MTMEEEIHIRFPLAEVRAVLEGGDPKDLMLRMEQAVESYDQAQKQNEAELGDALEAGTPDWSGSEQKVKFVVHSPELGSTDPNEKNLVRSIRFLEPIEKRAGEGMDISLDTETGEAIVSRWPLVLEMCKEAHDGDSAEGGLDDQEG
jgi:hypothetical protein